MISSVLQVKYLDIGIYDELSMTREKKCGKVNYKSEGIKARKLGLYKLWQKKRSMDLQMLKSLNIAIPAFFKKPTTYFLKILS